jgi:CMP-N-acetylneuraminic acid synthetase
MRRIAESYLEPYFPGAQPHRRQDKPPAFARNGAAISITRTSRLAEYVFGRLIPYPMDAESSVDIDTLDDLHVAERMLRSRR